MEEEMPKIQINLELCDGCGVCVALCPAFVLELRNGKVQVVNPEACLGIRAKQLCSECLEMMETCLGCVACVKGCPAAAIEILEI
jgi:NAD-dependent dihydropyrimidine dehydrogenase PreA subunit